MVEKSIFSLNHDQINQGKRIVLLTYGSRGDVEPFIALGTRLLQIGYEVRLIAPVPFMSFAESYGIEFVPINSDPDELGKLFANQAGKNWFKMIKSMADHVKPIAIDTFQTIRNSTQDADLIIHSFLMTDAGRTISQKQGIPDISAQLFPVFMSTGEFAPVALPDLPLGNSYRIGMHKLNTFMFQSSARFMFKRLKKTSPELPDLAPWPFSEPIQKQPPILFAYSEHVLPKPNDWPSNAFVTGYWQLPIPSDWVPPTDLITFITHGEPPIFFSPGSMQSKKSDELLTKVLHAARNINKRIIVGVSSEVVSPELLGKDVFCVRGIPYRWLFPQMSFVMHHGGAGTTGTAVTAGIPNSAIPFSVDQTFWARRLNKLGVGPQFPSLNKLSIDKLEELIIDGVNNIEYKKQAENIAEKIKTEDGIASAIKIINQLLPT